MTKKTRYFIIGSALFLMVGLSVGVVAYYGGFPGLSLAQGAAVDELRFVPADASVVAYVNVRDVMNSDFRKKVQTLQPAGSEKGQQEFRDQTGINIETDIESVLAYMAPGTSPADRNGVVLARGVFNENKIKSLLAQHGAREERYRDKTLFLPPSGTGAIHSGGPGALSFLEAGLVAVGSAEAVKRTIDVHASGGGGNVLGNPELVKLIDSVKGNSNAWAVGRFDALTGQAKLPAQVASQIPAVTWFTASGRVNGGVACDLSMEAKDEQAAQNLSKVIDGFIALGQLQMNSSGAAGVQDIIKSLKLQTSSDGKRVAISFAVSPDLLETLKQLDGVKNKKKAPGAPEPPQVPEPPPPPDVKR